MSTHFIVAFDCPRSKFTYPANPISQRLVKDAGGLSQMSDKDRKKIKFKTVRPGDACSDMPQTTLDVYVPRGWVVKTDEVTDG